MMCSLHSLASAVSVLMLFWRRLCCPSLLLAFACLATGCGQGAMEVEEEAHHEFPPHRPSSYEHLVSELERRVALHQAEGSKAWDDSELRDLVGWIPEFAADSELKRQDFEAAAKLGLELQVQLSAGGVISGDRVQSVGDVLSGLRDLVERSRDPNGAVSH